MAGIVHRRSLSGAAVLASLMTLGLGATIHAYGASGPSCQAFGVSQSVTPGKTPILFVHGINSSYQTWASAQPPNGGTVTGTTESPLAYVVHSLGSAKVAGYTFDWSATSGKRGPVEWVTSPPSPDLSTRLARAIGCVAKAAGHQVIIIAHSMGGLITEKASALGPTGANVKPTDLAAVFTLGTPYRGSWLASNTVQPGTDPLLNAVVQATEYLCTQRAHFKPSNQPLPKPSLKTHTKPSNQPSLTHFKPSGVIENIAGICPLANEWNDPGVVAMRLKPGPQTMLPSPPASLPWYRLAASVQGELRPVWPLRISESLNDIGDGVVSTPSQLNGQPGTAQTTQICTITGTAGHGRSARPVPRKPSFFDALGSPCFHIREPYSKTLLDDIISIIRSKNMIPTASVSTPRRLATPQQSPAGAPTSPPSTPPTPGSTLPPWAGGLGAGVTIEPPSVGWGFDSVYGYMVNLHPQDSPASCDYVVPSSQSTCQSVLNNGAQDGTFVEVTWQSIGSEYAAIDGDEALVVLDYAGLCLQVGIQENCLADNTDPAALLDSGQSFNALWAQATSGSNNEIELIPLLQVNGTWYVDYTQFPYPRYS